jgi:uncharacterized membrane protein
VTHRRPDCSCHQFRRPRPYPLPRRAAISLGAGAIHARYYYLNGGSGIDFKQQQAPAYSDFAYLAFTVGMAYAPSETEPATTAIRKTALGHALLSYGHGTIIIAVAINLVTNIGQS